MSGSPLSELSGGAVCVFLTRQRPSGPSVRLSAHGDWTARADGAGRGPGGDRREGGMGRRSGPRRQVEERTEGEEQPEERGGCWRRGR